MTERWRRLDGADSGASLSGGSVTAVALKDGPPSHADAESLGVTELRGLVTRLAELQIAATDVGQIDQLRALEDVKAACAAAQARVTARFSTDRRSVAERNGTCLAAAREQEQVREGPSGEGEARQVRAARIRRKAARLAARSAAAEVALARRESPQRGGRFVGFAQALVDEMPHTLAALESGVLNEWRATLLVRETACLTREQRSAVDAELAADPSRLEGIGDSRLVAMAKRAAYRLDAESVTKRAAKAAGDRRVSMRAAPDCMAYVTQLLPVASAVACFAALTNAVDTAPEGADGRTRDQRLADEAVARLMGRGSGAVTGTATGTAPSVATGTAPSAATAAASGDETPDQAPADGVVVTQEPVESSRPAHSDDPVDAVRRAYQEAASRKMGQSSGDHRRSAQRRTAGVGKHSGASRPGTNQPGTSPPAPVSEDSLPPGVGLVINMTISDRSLLGDSDDPATLTGNIPIPAPVARRMVGRLPREANVWIRRLYTRPKTGELVSMESHQRAFTPAMRRLLFVRDQDTCRTPWCSAPARHADHIRPVKDGGPTVISNGQALSEDCNYIRSVPGWQGRRAPTGDIRITSPTGHTYTSPVPAQGTRWRTDVRMPLEDWCSVILDNAS